jgi:hypothetical protein
VTPPPCVGFAQGRPAESFRAPNLGQLPRPELPEGITSALPRIPKIGGLKLQSEEVSILGTGQIFSGTPFACGSVRAREGVGEHEYFPDSKSRIWLSARPRVDAIATGCAFRGRVRGPGCGRTWGIHALMPRAVRLWKITGGRSPRVLLLARLEPHGSPSLAGWRLSWDRRNSVW